MKHVIHHDLSPDIAKRAAQAALDTYRERFPNADPKARWVSDTEAEFALTLKGMKLAGTLEIKERAIEMDLDVPFLLRPFKGVATEVVEREVRAWIERAKNGKV